MQLLHIDIPLKSRTDRVEIYPIGDVHLAKANCAEKELRAQIRYILDRSKRTDRQIRVILGGDIHNGINIQDAKRFDFAELADWFFTNKTKKTPKGNADSIKDTLSNMVLAESKHAVELFRPIAHLCIGAIEGNHEDTIRRRHNVDVQAYFCEALGIPNLTDEAIIRMRCVRANSASSPIVVYARHGHGGGRSAGAAPIKLANMLAEWESADICFTGHDHTFHVLPPKPVLAVPRAGSLPAKMTTRHRWAADWGAWLYSHNVGRGSYESRACYPARPMMTCKAVVWPFWRLREGGRDLTVPKIEVRSYPIL